MAEPIAPGSTRNDQRLYGVSANLDLPVGLYPVVSAACMRPYESDAGIAVQFQTRQEYLSQPVCGGYAFGVSCYDSEFYSIYWVVFKEWHSCVFSM